MRVSPGLFLQTVALAALAWGLCFCPAQGAGEDEPAHRIPEGVYIELTRDFYEALKEGDSGTGGRVYSDSPSQEYFRRIAVASEFAVKTNLEILKRQDEMIRILDRIAEQQLKLCGESMQFSVPQPVR
jgi:hypothetical protein